MKKFQEIFRQSKPVIGMIHVAALPGTPRYGGFLNEIVDKARREARVYFEAEIDAVMIENMHDAPYLKTSVGPEIVATMTAVAVAVRNELAHKPVGVQILAGANKAALAVAQAAQLDFIRAEGFVYGHLADEGYIECCAGELLRFRKQIGAEQVAIFTDIKKKHSSHAITADVTIEDTAHAAEFFMSDGVIVTGTATGEEASIKEIRTVKAKIEIPVLVGSGVTYDNLQTYLSLSDAMIVGSYFKEGGVWSNELDVDRLARFMDKARQLRD
jgi:membrane complex biogenesis BtpA family protein